MGPPFVNSPRRQSRDGHRDVAGQARSPQGFDPHPSSTANKKWAVQAKEETGKAGPAPNLTHQKTTQGIAASHLILDSHRRRPLAASLKPDRLIIPKKSQRKKTRSSSGA